MTLFCSRLAASTSREPEGEAQIEMAAGRSSHLLHAAQHSYGWLLLTPHVRVDIPSCMA
jgi:hypothetical protein